MSLRQLLPILDIVGTANKHLARVAKFMQKYGDMELFPVKLQVLTHALSCNLRHVLHERQCLEQDDAGMCCLTCLRPAPFQLLSSPLEETAYRQA